MDVRFAHVGAKFAKLKTDRILWIIALTVGNNLSAANGLHHHQSHCGRSALMFQVGRSIVVNRSAERFCPTEYAAQARKGHHA